MGLKKLRGAVPRRVLLVSAVVGAVIMGDSMLYNVLPSHVAEFGIPIGLVGVLLSANRVVRLFSNPLAAWAVQRFGLTSLLVAAVVLAIGTTVTYGTVQWFWALLLARVLWGVCFSIFRLGGYLVVLEESHETTRGRLLGSYGVGVRVGSVVGVMLGGVLFDLTGRTTSFLIIAALGLLGLPAAISLGRQARPPTVIDEPSIASTSQPQENPGKGFRRRAWDFLLTPLPELDFRHRRQLLAASFTFFSLNLAVSGILVSSLGFYLSQQLEGGIAVAGIVIGIATVNGVLLSTRWLSGIAAPYFGYIGDRRGRERVLLAAMPVLILAMLLFALPLPPWITVSMLPFAFLATAASTISLDALVGGLVPANRRANVMSRYATWQDIGSAIGPLVAFAVLSFSSLTPVYVGGATLLAVAVGLFMMASRYRMARQPVSTERAS
ncbi:MAG: MFS transporter [Chloroflexi bacterium]|nr:MFS transporter [Chloroflexota bacterium]